VTPTQILDIIGRLFTAARHPAVTEVYHYSGALTV
jgi:hypothetical protein